MAIFYLFSEEIAKEIFFVFRFDVWPGARILAFTSNKPTHCLLDYGDFNRGLLVENYDLLVLKKIVAYFSSHLILHIITLPCFSLIKPV